jgi:transketolase
VLALTRQNLPASRSRFVEENMCARGAYELSPASTKAEVSLFASGSEVAIAIAAQAELERKGIPARVVSVPSFELFREQPAAYRHGVIGTAPARVAVEAAIRMGWDEIIGTDGAFVGMTGFGASAPYKDLYKHFGITAEAVVTAAIDALGRERTAAGLKSARRS